MGSIRGEVIDQIEVWPYALYAEIRHTLAEKDVGILAIYETQRIELSKLDEEFCVRSLIRVGRLLVCHWCQTRLGVLHPTTSETRESWAEIENEKKNDFEANLATGLLNEWGDLSKSGIIVETHRGDLFDKVLDTA